MIRYIAVAYFLFYLAVYGAETNWDFHKHVSPLDEILVGPLLWMLGFAALQNGSIQWRYSAVTRSESPVLYWAMVASVFAIGFGMVVMGMRRALT